MADFEAFPKIARLNRDIIITEKIDGTNAQIVIEDDGTVRAGSRNRFITPQSDNFGFAGWVQEHENALREILGPGRHFGEWWGPGIQRGYGVPFKRLSLFAPRWQWLNEPEARAARPKVPPSLLAVPVLAKYTFSQAVIESTLQALRDNGSYAAPGFMKPEGIVIFHTAASALFKVTLEGDEKPKGSKE